MDKLDQNIISELAKWFGRNVTIKHATKTNGQGLYNFSGLVTEVHVNGGLSIQNKDLGYGYTINLHADHEIIINE